MRKMLIILLGVGAVVLIFISILTAPVKKQPAPQTFPTPTPVVEPNQTNQINYKAIFPNETVASEMAKGLANPDSVNHTDGYTVFSYKTTSPNLNNELYVKGINATYFVEQATGDNSYYSDFLLKNPGVTPQVLYDSTYVNIGFEWYVFPDKGVAFLASKDTGSTMQILYFSATTLDDFLKTAGKTFSLNTTDLSTKDTEGKGLQ